MEEMIGPVKITSQIDKEIMQVMRKENKWSPSIRTCKGIIRIEAKWVQRKL
jgi:hypothetical protein